MSLWLALRIALKEDVIWFSDMSPCRIVHVLGATTDDTKEQICLPLSPKLEMPQR